MVYKQSECYNFNSSATKTRPLMELIKGIYLTESGFIQIINNILSTDVNIATKCICEKYIISSEDFKNHFKLINNIEKQVEKITKNKSAHDDILSTVPPTNINSIQNTEKLFRNIKYKELYSFIREINTLMKISAKPKIFINQTLIFMELFTNIMYTICEVYELCRKNEKVKIIESNIQITDLNHLKKGYTGIWAQLHRVISTHDKSKFIPVIHKDVCQYSNLPSKLFHELRKNMLDSLKQMCRVKVCLIKLKTKILEAHSSEEEICTIRQLSETIPEFSEIMAEYNKCETKNVKSFEDVLVAPCINNTVGTVEACTELNQAPVLNFDIDIQHLPEIVNQKIDHHLPSDIVRNITINTECCNTNFSNFSHETKTLELDTAIDYLCLFAFTNNNPDSFYVNIPKEGNCVDTAKNVHYIPCRITNEMLCIETVNSDDDDNVKYLNETLAPKLCDLQENTETNREDPNCAGSQKITEIKTETKEAYTQNEESIQLDMYKIDSSCQTDYKLEKTKKPKIHISQSRIKKFPKKSCKRRKKTISLTILESNESRSSIKKTADNSSSKWPIEGNYINKESRGERTVKFDILKESRIFKSFGKQMSINKYSAQSVDILEYKNTNKDLIFESTWPLNKHDQVKVCETDFNHLASINGKNNFHTFGKSTEQKNFSILPTIISDDDITLSIIKNHDEALKSTINSNVEETNQAITNSIKVIKSSLNSNVKDISRPSIYRNVNETRSNNVHETQRPAVKKNVSDIIKLSRSSNTKEMRPQINNNIREIMEPLASNRVKETMKISSSNKEGIRPLQNKSIDKIKFPEPDNIDGLKHSLYLTVNNSTDKTKTGCTSHSNVPKIRTDVMKPSTHLTINNTGNRNKVNNNNNNQARINNKDFKCLPLEVEIHSVCETETITASSAVPHTQVEKTEADISVKQTSFRLFDVNGYPLTDIDGNILKDSNGNLLIHLDQHGKPLDRTEIFDAAGVSCYSIKYNPTTESLFENIGIKLSDNRFKNPVQIYDKYGRPLTDSQGRLLANIHGKTLLIFDNFGIPSSDVYGSSIYKKPGVKWSYNDLFFTRNTHDEKQNKENSLFVTTCDEKFISREVNLNCKPGKSYVVYEMLEDVKSEKSEIKENVKNNKTVLPRTHNKQGKTGEHKLDKSLELVNQENKKLIKNKLSLQKNALLNSQCSKLSDTFNKNKERKRLFHHANELFLPLIKGNISMQNQNVHFKESLNTRRNQTDKYMDLLRSIVYVNIISDKTLALERSNRSFKYRKPIFNEILPKTSNKCGTVIKHDSTVYPEDKFSRSVSVIINSKKDKNKHLYFESGDAKDVLLPCVNNKNETDDIIKENCEAVHKNIKFYNVLHKKNISHRLANVENKLKFALYERGINRVSLQQIHIPLCEKKSVKYLNIDINRAHREIIFKQSDKDIKNTEQIVQIKYNNKNFLKHHEKHSKSGSSVSYYKQLEKKDDRLESLSEKKHKKNKENIKHLEKKRGKSKKRVEEKLIKKRTLSKTVCKNLKKSLFKTSTPEEEIHNKKSVISSIFDIPLKYLFGKLEGKVIDVSIDTNENLAEENLKYKILAKDLKRTDKKTNIFESKKANGDKENPLIDENKSGEIKKMLSTSNLINMENIIQEQDNALCHRDNNKENENNQNKSKHSDTKVKERRPQNITYEHNLTDKQKSVGSIKTKNTTCIKNKAVLKQQNDHQYVVLNEETNCNHVHQNTNGAVRVNRYQSIHCSANKNKINIIYKHKSHSHCRNRMHNQNIRQTYECRPEMYLNNFHNSMNTLCGNETHLYHFSQPLNQSRQQIRLKNEDLFLKWYDSNGQLVKTYHHNDKLSPLLKHNKPAVSYRKAFQEIYNTPHKLHYIPEHNTLDHYHGDHCINGI